MVFATKSATSVRHLQKNTKEKRRKSLIYSALLPNQDSRSELTPQKDCSMLLRNEMLRNFSLSPKSLTRFRGPRIEGSRP